MGVVLEVRVFPLISAVDADGRWLNIPTAGMAPVGNFQIGEKFDRPLWLMVSSVCRQTMGTSGTYHGLVNS